MTLPNPDERPSVSEALKILNSIKKSVLRRRVWKITLSTSQRFYIKYFGAKILWLYIHGCVLLIPPTQDKHTLSVFLPEQVILLEHSIQMIQIQKDLPIRELIRPKWVIHQNREYMI